MIFHPRSAAPHDIPSSGAEKASFNFKSIFWQPRKFSRPAVAKSIEPSTHKKTLNAPYAISRAGFLKTKMLLFATNKSWRGFPKRPRASFFRNEFLNYKIKSTIDTPKPRTQKKFELEMRDCKDFRAVSYLNSNFDNNLGQLSVLSTLMFCVEMRFFA